MSVDAKQQRIEELERTLRNIARIGGNLPDNRLTGRTGPNDAQSRGFMYTEARWLALNALNTTIEKLWE